MFINDQREAEEAKKLKSDNFGKIPISGIYRISVNDISFDMLTVNSDDTSVTDRFWNDNYQDYTLEKWVLWTKEEGIHIDIGAHTGMYTIAAFAANSNNQLISIEPFDLNFHRIITNLRLNNLSQKKISLFNYAVSDTNKKVKFHINSPLSYLSKGGKISTSGKDINAIKLDSLVISNTKMKVKSLKIDTEGEDLNVLKGSINLINKFMPKIIVETRRDNIEQIIDFLLSSGYKNIYDEKENSIKKGNLIEFDNKQIVKDIFCDHY